MWSSAHHLLLGIRPPQAKHVSTAIKLSLDGIYGAALIEPEHFIVQIEQRDDEFKPAVEAVTSLGINLRVCIRVLISIWSPNSAISPVLVVVQVNVGVVMR